MPTRTHFVFLMHPKEWKQEKAATGRLTHLCLPNSVIHVGTDFDHHVEVQALIADRENFCVLLHPGRDALNLSTDAWGPESLNGRQLVVILLDATWSLGRKMLRLSPSLQRLPRIVFTPATPSRYLIKQQPHPHCLSTLEAVHELLGVLERGGLDRYPLPTQLLQLFKRMQDFQIACAADPSRPGYRRRAYQPPALRKGFTGESGRRRANFFPS